ncbi:hypothetical protein JAO29_22855 [Edaphobacter sp. HDX4]|uniref:hypothetical protein n=1 Tax=Edaphobacter sp. HDX4 TaxID=2794064 RepID=UPI002FE6BEF4
MRSRRLKKAVKFGLFALILAIAVGFIVKNLWNLLIPQIFGWHTISFWQALGLFLLAKILFGGFHPRAKGGGWKARMRDRMEQMTPEERARFREGMLCGRRPFARSVEREAHQ